MYMDSRISQWCVVLVANILLLFIIYEYTNVLGYNPQTVMSTAAYPKRKSFKTSSGNMLKSKEKPARPRSDYTPSNVFYIWCGEDRQFVFRNYISVMSVVKLIKPDVIVFFYEHLPVVDRQIYNTWFNEIQAKLPFFHAQRIAKGDVTCDQLKMSQRASLSALLGKKGGMYVHENTILANFPPHLLTDNAIDALAANGTGGFMMAKRGFVKDPPKAKDGEFHQLQCIGRDNYTSHAAVSMICLTTDSEFYPRDIWEVDDQFGRLVRNIFYGSSEVPKPRQSYEDLAPNIGHMVWVGGGPMDYLFYLCVLSLIYVAEMDTVYIHGDQPPSGVYWDQIRNHNKLIFIRRDITTIYGQKVKVPAHVSDIWRVDFMIKYGGFYIDNDAVVVKPMSRELRSYDAVAAYDWVKWNVPFQNVLNFGIMIGKPNAKFWQVFQESMKYFRDGDWSWNGLRQPYKIKERQPELMRIDPRLQVICFQSLCHPTWWPNFENRGIHHKNSKSITNWRNDTFSYHWTTPTPRELQNKTELLASDSMFAEIGRYILEKAGQL